MGTECLPEELTEEILPRFPVKSLMRSKILSKFYSALIASHRFITKHFQFSAENPQLLVFHCQSKLSSKPCISLFSGGLLRTSFDLGLPISEMPQAALDLGLPFTEESQPPIDLGLLIPKTSQAPLDSGLPFVEESDSPIDLGIPFLDISQPFSGSRLTIPEISKPAVDLGLALPGSPQHLFDACLPFPTVSLPYVNLELPMPKISQPPVDLELPFPDKHVLKIIPYGPCNGILCLHGSYIASPDELILWNPATKEVKVLPLPDAPSSGMEIYIHGFGIDPKTNDYKVLSISTIMELQLAFELLGVTVIPMVKVYSLSTNSWKKIDAAISTFDFGDSVCNSYLNGACHWLAKNRQAIDCFDMSNEVFYKMKLPPVVEECPHEHLVNCNVAVLDNCIAYVQEYCSRFLLGHRIEIWVMNKHGVEESWTKRFSIGPLFGLGKFQSFWKPDEILVTGEDNETLVSYNLKTQRPVMVFPVDCGLMLFPAVRYEESMFPISIMPKD